MFLESFQNIDFDGINELLKSEYDLSATLCLISHHQFEIQGDDLISGHKEKILQYKQSLEKDEDGSVYEAYLDEDHFILAKAIDHSTEKDYVVLSVKANKAEQFTSAVTQFLHLSFNSNFEIFQLNDELNSMSDDLSDRYEELNLFYGLDEVVESKSHEQSFTTLSRLVNDCSHYLKTDIVTLSIPLASLTLDAINSTNKEFVEKWHTSDNTIKQSIGDYTASLEFARVINDTAEVQTICHNQLKSKLATAPIYGPSHKCLGNISLLRSSSQPDFSNSDRRLLRVVAEQIATIVSGGFDILTGLLNRLGVETPINQSIYLDNDQQHMLLLNLDQFKMINDACGRSAGDDLLKMVAHLIKHIVGNEAIIARVGGDEFTIILPNSTAQMAKDTAKEIVNLLISRGFKASDLAFELSAGVGIVTLDNSVSDASEALVFANIACQIAKRKGRGGIFLYDGESSLIQSAKEIIDWATRIREVLQNDHLLLNFQKIVPLYDAQSTHHHYETLLRMDPKSGIESTSPFQMIKAAESYNMISQIDRWVVTNAMKTLQDCIDRYPELDISFSVNLSGKSINDEFFSFLHKQFDKAPHLIPRITLEITETAVMSDMNVAVRLIETLRKRGVEFSLDDFGTGMSSFGNLSSLPVDFLKIDGSFVKEIVRDRVSFAMVESMNNIAHIMDLKTIAEYVEDNEITEALRRIGVDFGQGYGLNKPMCIEDQLEILRSQNMLSSAMPSIVPLNKKA